MQDPTPAYPAENQTCDGSDLKSHFPFAKAGSLDRESFGRGNVAQPAHSKFAPDNDRHHPGRNDPELHERYKSGRN